MTALSAAEIAVGMLYALAVGASLGAFYDIFRVARTLLGMRPDASETPQIRLPLVGQPVKAHRKSGVFAAAFTFACDIAFFAVATAVYNALVFHAAYGQNRWFLTLAAICGFILYHFTLGSLVMRTSGLIRFVICAAAAYVAFFVSLPFCAANKFILRPLGAKFFKKINEKRTKKARKALAHSLTMVYNIDEE